MTGKRRFSIIPIGVFDSGLGGLTILRALRMALPQQDFVYLGDQANAPYGHKDAAHIRELTVQGIKCLFRADCSLVILACNTASAVALHDIQTEWLDPSQRRVLGVFVPIIEHLTSRDWGDNSPPTHTGLRDVALFATPATVASGAFSRELRFRARDVHVEAQACEGLVAAIEAGNMQDAIELVKRHVDALLKRLPAPQCAVLGCTHYPLVAEAFQKALPPETRLTSQPDLVAASLKSYLIRHREFAGGSGKFRYLTTGHPATVSSSAKVFAADPTDFETADYADATTPR